MEKLKEAEEKVKELKEWYESNEREYSKWERPRVYETEREIIRAIAKGVRIIWCYGDIEILERTRKKAKKKGIYFIPVEREVK